MKKIKYLLLLAILFIPVSVNAATGTVKINCTPTTVNPGANIACTVKGTVSEGDSVGSLRMNIQLGGDLSVINFTKNADWNGGLSDNRISLYNEVQVENTFDIGILNLKANDSASSGQASITFSDILFSNDYDTEGGTIDVTSDTVNITVSTASTAVGLETLVPTVGSLQQQFVPDLYSYWLKLPAEAINFGFTLSAKNPNDTISVYDANNPEENLNPSSIVFNPSGGESSMAVKIQVGEVIYTVIVSKDVATDDKGYELSSLKVGDVTVELTSGKYSYDVLLKDVSSYSVIATITDNEKYEILTDLSNLKTGAGSFSIITAPKDNSSGLEGKTYTINVSEGSAPPSVSVPPSSKPPTNPPTGGALSVFVALVLIASFGASIYFYKRNMGYFNN